jgi:hypothetical protein
MKRKYILFAMMILIGLSSLGYYVYTKSPRYTLAQIKKAIDQHDTQTFEKLVDVESITSSAIDSILESKIQNGHSDKEGIGETIGKGLIKLLKPQLSLIAKQELIKYVETGDFEKQQVSSPSLQPQVSLQNILKQTGSSKANFKGIEYVKKEGKIAYVGLTFHNNDYKTDMTLDIKMRDRNGYWQIVDFSNLNQYLSKIDELETKRMTEVNTPILKAISKCLNTEYFRTDNLTDSFGIRKAIKFTLGLKNVGEKEITEYEINLNCSDINQSFSRKVKLNYKGNIRPGTVGTGSWNVEMNIFDINDQKLFNTPEKNMKIDGEVERVMFTDGSELRLIKKYESVSN